CGHPERTIISIEPLDCTGDEFRAAFEDADKGNKFIFSTSGAIVDIGGGSGAWEKGQILCIDGNVISVLPSSSLPATQQELNQRQEQAIDDLTVWLSRQPSCVGPAL